MSLPRVTILSPTLTGNALFRTDAMLRLLRRDFHVQIVAFEGSTRIYEPLADVVEYQRAERVHAASVFGASRLGARVDRAIKGDVVVCIKPLMHSYGAALLASRRTRRPIILDVDDWELGFLSQSPYWEMRSWGRRWVTAIDSPLYTRLLDGFIYKAAAVTVSNSFLQGVYGGHWIPHVRDNGVWAPSDAIHTDTRDEVLFAGAPRGHKGLPTLLKAWTLIRHPSALLHLVVPDPAEEMLRKMKVEEHPRVRVSGPYRFDALRGIISSARVVVVPQDNSPGSVGQLPMKLIDAMAAGRAIVTTDVGDASRWLGDGAGVVVPPGCAGALADAIDHLLAHPAEAAEMGARARRRFLTFGSEEAVRPRIVALVRAVIERTILPLASPAFSLDPDGSRCADPDTGALGSH